MGAIPRDELAAAATEIVAGTFGSQLDYYDDAAATTYATVWGIVDTVSEDAAGVSTLDVTVPVQTGFVASAKIGAGACFRYPSSTGKLYRIEKKDYGPDGWQSSITVECRCVRADIEPGYQR